VVEEQKSGKSGKKKLGGGLTLTLQLPTSDRDSNQIRTAFKTNPRQQPDEEEAELFIASARFAHRVDHTFASLTLQA